MDFGNRWTRFTKKLYGLKLYGLYILTGRFCDTPAFFVLFQEF
jgi:hypothetical protein